MVLLQRKRVLAAAQEATPGSIEALDAADAQFHVFDVKIDPDIDFQEREGQGGFSPMAGVPGARAGGVSFAVELCGSGDAGDPVPGWADTFLPACGMVKATNVFSPESKHPTQATAKTKCLTLGVYENGRLKRLRGAMGTAVVRLTGGAQPIRLEFSFKGIWEAPTDQAILAPTYPSIEPLRFADADIQIGVWHPKLQELTIDLGNQVELREDAEDPSGYATAAIVGRRVVGTLNPEAPLVATKDLHGQWLARTEQALAIIVPNGSADGNRVTLSAPKFQVTNVQSAERGGVVVDDVSFQLVRSADAGDDEFTITFD